MVRAAVSDLAASSAPVIFCERFSAGCCNGGAACGTAPASTPDGLAAGVTALSLAICLSAALILFSPDGATGGGAGDAAILVLDFAPFAIRKESASAAPVDEGFAAPCRASAEFADATSPEAAPSFVAPLFSLSNAAVEEAAGALGGVSGFPRWTAGSLSATWTPLCEPGRSKRAVSQTASTTAAATAGTNHRHENLSRGEGLAWAGSTETGSVTAGGAAGAAAIATSSTNAGSLSLSRLN